MNVDTSNEIAKELAARLADAEAAKDKLEAANSVLREEIERKNKALEGFIAENDALKAELGGKRPPGTGGRNAKNGGTGGGHDGPDQAEDLVSRARRLGW